MNFSKSTALVATVVAAVITNSVEAMVICLAALSIGALWSSSSPDLGPEAICGRYGQIDPKLVFADDSYLYAGKLVKLHPRIEQWSERLGQAGTQLRNVVVIANLGLTTDCSKVYRGSIDACLSEWSSNACSVFCALSIYCSINTLVPICECLYRFKSPMPPSPLVRDVRTRNSIFFTSFAITTRCKCYLIITLVDSVSFFGWFGVRDLHKWADVAPQRNNPSSTISLNIN